MITGLPQEFTDQLEAKSRRPVQLIEFILPDETFYLSDKTIGKGQGLANDYQPWIESWGVLKDNTNINNIFEGNSLEIRSATISILVSPPSRTFVKKLFQVGVENTRVRLYQWFSNLASPPTLIDIMVCQDPIKHSEASMLLSIDLVSTLMKADPYLWPQEPGIEDQPVVVGKATGMPLKDLQTARVTAIAQDMEYDYLGVVFVDNGVGFPASGIISIDSEDMEYEWISASGIKIIARAQNGTTARPHLRGALACPYGAIYDYAICSGSVLEVDNLLANGEPYLNEVAFFPGQNPVIARFIGRPPWLKVKPGADGDPIIPDPVIATEYSNRTEQHYGNTASEPTGDSAINAASGSATLAISQHTGGGAGNLINRLSKDYTATNTGSVFDNDKLQSTAGDSIKNNRSSLAYHTDDGVIGSIQHRYGWDDSHYGDLTSLVVEVYVHSLTIKHADIKIEFVFVTEAGSETVLDEETILEHDGDVFGQASKFSGKGLSFDVKSLVNTFADLVNCKLMLRFTNIRINMDAGSSTSYTQVTIGIVTWDVGYFTPVGSIPSPYQELVSHFNRDLSGTGAITNVTAKVYFSATLSNAEVGIAVVRRSTSDRDDNSNLWSSDISDNLSGSEMSFDLGSMSWAELQATRVGVFHQITGIDDEDITRSCTVSFNYVKWIVTYQPGQIETPDELRVVYADTLVCDVTSNLGEDPTPAQVVRHMIEDHSDAGSYIDGSDFDTAHANYNAAGYYLNGVLDVGTKLHAALKQVMMEGMCRLLFNQGLIKLLSYFEQIDTEVDFEVSTDDIQIRSRKTDNQPTSRIKNDITIMYDKDYENGVYDGKVNEENSESVARFFRKDYRRELQLVNSEVVAQLHANRLLSILSTPTSVYSFNMFMKGYTLEKGDKISVRTFLDPRFISVGNILSIERTFGKGKQQQINLFNIKIANPETYANLDLEEAIIVDDSSHLILKGLILNETVIVDDSEYKYFREHTFSNERLRVEESLSLERCQVNGCGTCGCGVHPCGK